MSAASVPFGQTPDGHPAQLLTLENSELRVRITDFGGRIVSIEMLRPKTADFDVLLGFDEVSQYAQAGGAFGALLGRNANRIARGELTIDGRQYQLATNDRGATLHGGPHGFDMVFWNVASATQDELVLANVSPDGDQGFPGELRVEARYRVTGSSLSLEFRAETSATTIASFSAHPYFNLADVASGGILGHEVTIAADAFLPTDANQIPTGEIRPVDGTPFDFRRPMTINARIRRADPQLLHGQGYDHYYVLPPREGDKPRFAARSRDPGSGRFVEIHTTQPGLQFYTGNQLKGSVAGRGGIIYRQSAGLAFEPQGFPDAPHHPNFPSTMLRPGQTYRETIEYRFGLT
ncbi:MAG: galactose mutarotase [Alphaproteobacteria bacterium]|nr:galactose mutarotase [Alphaproteobacteria bacterium]MBV9154242.1 galactose mutarotase [Alphaproteobacteria bacterium]MBV9966570.1 galactose mutarotase [Alphaproteobacteria bacterium]